MYKIVIDTRERTPFQFTKSKLCEGIKVKKLDTGDYSIEGMEDIICIERKKSVSEIAQNVTQQRFKNELKRMQDFKYRLIICEFDWADVVRYPYGAGLPKNVMKRVRVRGNFLISALMSFDLDYDIPIHYAGTTKAATLYTKLYLEQVWKRENG